MAEAGGNRPHPARTLALLGAGGHAGVVVRLVASCLRHESAGRAAALFERLWIVGASDAFLAEAALALRRHLSAAADVRAFGSDEALRAALPADERARVANGVGRRPARAPDSGEGAWTGGSAAFLDAYIDDTAHRFDFPALLHPSVICVDEMTQRHEGSGGEWTAEAGPGRICAGAQVHAGAVIGARTVVGAHAIINTRASLDHDVTIGARAFVGPGAVLCGGVIVEDGAFIGAGATVLPQMRIGRGAVVPAGICVRAPVAPGRLARRG